MLLAYHGQRAHRYLLRGAFPLFGVVLCACASDHVSPRDLEGASPLEGTPRIEGATRGAAFGHHVSCATDLGGDGIDDLVVGAALEGDGAGAVYVFDGPPEDRAEPRAILRGERPGDQAGISVAALRDLDGDGAGDLAIGAFLHDPRGRDEAPGAAYVFYGPVRGERSLAEADVKLVGEQSQDGAGFVVERAGDLDHDGHDDLAIAAFHAAGGGRVYVFYGPIARGERSLAEADAIIDAAARDDHAGLSIAGGGDLTGDGIDDLAVGAPYFDGDVADSGAAFVIAGPIRGVIRASDAAAIVLGVEQAASSLAIGDTDGDGRADLVIGSAIVDGGRGVVNIARGPLSGTIDSADTIALRGDMPGDGFGVSVAAGFDRDRDGRGDLLVGAWGTDAAGAETGSAYLFYGPVDRGERAIMAGELGGDTAAASVGVCETDRRPIIAIGAPGASGVAPGAGEVLLVP